MEAKLLSDCTSPIIIDDNPKDQYQIVFEPSEYQIIKMGFKSNHAGAKFTHPNIFATKKTIHEFKHYRSGGSKFWTASAGIDHYLIIPRNKITILPEKGYSYIPAEINGVKVSFNVTGGTNNGWTDYLGVRSTISVNHKLSDLKKLAEVAIRDSQIEDTVAIEELTEDEENWWAFYDAKANPKIKENIAKMIEDGKKPRIVMQGGYICNSGYGIEVLRRRGKRGADGWRKYDGAVNKIIGIFDGNRYSVKVNQIDWRKTEIANQNPVEVN